MSPDAGRRPAASFLGAVLVAAAPFAGAAAAVPAAALLFSIGPILAAGCLTIPLGTWLLVSADPVTMRRAIAAAMEPAASLC